MAVGQPMLLLHTRGARSGQPRSTPLLYTQHGRGYVVVASKAGADHHPAWYTLRGWSMTTTTAIRVYQQRAGQRIIPVVLLEPA